MSISGFSSFKEAEMLSVASRMCKQDYQEFGREVMLGIIAVLNSAIFGLGIANSLPLNMQDVETIPGVIRADWADCPL